MRTVCGWPKNVLNNMNLTHLLTLSRTFQALAEAEVHGLHSFGEHNLVDSTCGREGERGKRIK